MLQDIQKYSSFSILPRDMSQLIFAELVYRQVLNDVILEAFRDCALQVSCTEYLYIRFNTFAERNGCILMWYSLILETEEIYIYFDWQDLNLAEYPGFNDNWIDVIASQGLSLLTVDISGSDVTDTGLNHLKVCNNVEALNFNFCDQISDLGLQHISGAFPH